MDEQDWATGRWCLAGIGHDSIGGYEVWIDTGEEAHCFCVDRETYLAAKAEFDAPGGYGWRDGPYPEWTDRFPSTPGMSVHRFG